MSLMRQVISRWMVAVLLGISLSLNAKAEANSETMIPLGIEELVAASAAVVHGVVEEISTRRDESRRIFTEVTLVVTDCWKGNMQGNKIKFVQGGGTLGNERVEVSGQPHFLPKEEVVLFLVNNKRGESVIYAMNQGKFEVYQGDANEKLVRNSFHGSATKRKTKALDVKTDRNEKGSLTLESLKNKVSASTSHSK